MYIAHYHPRMVTKFVFKISMRKQTVVFRSPILTMKNSPGEVPSGMGIVYWIAGRYTVPTRLGRTLVDMRMQEELLAV